MEWREWMESAKKICENEMEKYRKWAIVGSQYERGIFYLGAELERRDIDLSSERAEEILRAYAFGYMMRDRRISESAREELRKAMKAEG